MYRALPARRARIAAAHTITREIRADLGAPFDDGNTANIKAPTLMLVGGESPDVIKGDYETVAAALPDVHVTIPEGQQHIAMDLIPEVFAQHVLACLRDQPQPAHTH